MARVISKFVRADEGVVYVEFLFAVIPLFVMFLAVCHFALLTIAKVVVGQAANQGARSAIVVLTEDPERYEGVPRGVVSEGAPSEDSIIEALLVELGQEKVPLSEGSPEGAQQGARMAPIRTAVYAPLLALAPHEQGWRDRPSVGDGVHGGWLEELPFVVKYTKAVSSISLRDARGGKELAAEPIERDALVTVRVNYLFHCAIPLVRVLACRSKESLLGGDAEVGSSSEHDKSSVLAQSEMLGWLRAFAPKESRFVLLTSEVTLPNQGAEYYE